MCIMDMDDISSQNKSKYLVLTASALFKMIMENKSLNRNYVSSDKMIAAQQLKSWEIIGVRKSKVKWHREQILNRQGESFEYLVKEFEAFLKVALSEALIYKMEWTVRLKRKGWLCKI